jgi:hypothetical protein
MNKTLLLAAAASLVVAASPASAARIIGNTPGSTAAYAAPTGNATITFDGTLPSTFSYSFLEAGIVSGDAFGRYAAPAFGPAGTAYLAVLNGGAFSAVTTTSAAYDTVSFFLGSIDAYNVVEVLSATGSVISRFTGTDFVANANGDQDIPNTNRRITIGRDVNDAAIGGIRFLSNGNSLEVDNVVFAVPEPSTWAMMFLGFGMIGTAARYRRRNRNVSYA